MQTLLAPGLRPDSNPLPDVGHEPAQTTSPRRRRRDASGFTMNELLVVMIIIGVLGLLATGIYFAFIRTAENTVLNSNIQSAAEEMQSALALNPSLADPGNANQLITELSSRTNLIWNDSWDSDPTSDTAETIRFQTIAKDTAAALATGTTPPELTWLLDGKSAVRLHIVDGDSGVWRCALIILKPSTSAIKTAAGTSYYRDPGTAATAATATTTALTDAAAGQIAAEVRGVWYDGGSSQSTNGLHDCSPTASGPSDNYLPANAQTWVIAARSAAELDSSSTAYAFTSGATGKRTFHRSPSQLDGE